MPKIAIRGREGLKLKAIPLRGKTPFLDIGLLRLRDSMANSARRRLHQSGQSRSAETVEAQLAWSNDSAHGLRKANQWPITPQDHAARSQPLFAPRLTERRAGACVMEFIPIQFRIFRSWPRCWQRPVSGKAANDFGCW